MVPFEHDIFIVSSIRNRGCQRQFLKLQSKNHYALIVSSEQSQRHYFISPLLVVSRVLYKCIEFLWSLTHDHYSKKSDIMVSEVDSHKVCFVHFALYDVVFVFY